MTSTGSNATVYEFDAPDERKTVPSFRFKLGKDPCVYTLIMPKVAIAVELTALMDGGSMREDLSNLEIGQRLTAVLWQLVQYIEPEDPEPLTVDDGQGGVIENPNVGRARGQARIVQRLRSPKDGLDVLDLADVFARACQAMFDRPIGPSPESSAKPGDGGTDSAAATPAQPDETSGT